MRGANYFLSRKLDPTFVSKLNCQMSSLITLRHKGSIAINGISLTVAEVLPKSFVAWIIPHTKRHTNLESARVGDLVNLEFDILAKYVERMLAKRRPQNGE